MPNDGPQHNVVPKAEEKKMFFVLCLTAFIMVIEVVGGYFSGSLALLADAGHMFTDVASLLLSWLAMRLGRKAPDEQRTFGYQRLKILAAYTNAVLLFFLSAIISVEAIDRITGTHKPVDATLMLIVASIGFATNLFSFFILNHKGHSPDMDDHHGHSHDGHNHEHDLNVHSALIHVLSDLMGAAAAVAAALIIMFTGWMPADPILSIFVSLLILVYAWKLAKKTVHILIEGTPDPELPEKIKSSILANIKGVRDVHHIHIWSLTENQPIATLDVIIEPTSDQQQVLCAIQRLLADAFHLDHVTIQIEKGPCFEL